MTRLTDDFAKRRAEGGKAVVFYVVAGDPDLDKTPAIVEALDRAGASVIELGIPFSDPLADGPTIQAASQRALTGGVTVVKTLECVRQIRQRSQIPIVLMTYLNPALQYGLERFANDAVAAGVDGCIQTDLTPEEGEAWIAAARKAGLDTVFLLAPTSTEERINKVAALSTGFIYCVSRTGVTGTQTNVPEELAGLVSRIRQASDTPICVGFGVSKPEHVHTICAVADGVVIGSALVDVIAKAGDGADLIEQVEAFARPLVEAARASGGSS
jgi:tryptophan synthase alpha chain